MPKKYPGLYLYYDWMEAIESLGPEQGFQLILNLYHYSKDNVPPKPLEGAGNLVQLLCVAQLNRSKAQSECARRSSPKGFEKTEPKKELPAILQNTDLYVDPDDDPEELALLQSALNR